MNILLYSWQCFKTTFAGYYEKFELLLALLQNSIYGISTQTHARVEGAASLRRHLCLYAQFRRNVCFLLTYQNAFIVRTHDPLFEIWMSL
jgi:hypothetical protein